jgi:tetratricopeptide (TPR) repeat protein
MHPYYELPRPDSLLHGWSLAGLGVLVGLLAAAAAAWRRSPVSAFGLGWFLLAVAPYLDLLAISPRPMGLADRYLYVPSIGVLLVLGDLLRRGVDLVSPRLSGAWRAPLLALATGVLAIGYGGIVAWYLPVWEDNVHLYARMIRDFPTASQPRMNLGTALLDRGEIDQGIRELEAAVRLRPDLVRPQINLAFATARRDPQAAFRVFDRVAPAAVDDLAYYLMRSHAHLGARQPADAADVLAAGLARFPESAELHMLLGRAREAQRNLPDALASYRHAAARFPHLPGALEGLGRVLAQLGDLEGAGVALVQARELRPNHLPTLRLLALLREAQGRQEESRRLWCELAQRSGDPGVIAEADARAARMPGGTGCRRP